MNYILKVIQTSIRFWQRLIFSQIIRLYNMGVPSLSFCVEREIGREREMTERKVGRGIEREKGLVERHIYR